jgi:aspartyl-tRNA synthetase
MLMAEKGAIREVIPFPKTAKGSELMCDAPAPVPERQLRELGIAVRKTS